MGAIAHSAMAQERQWSLDTSEGDAYLIFGVPDSDDVGVSFWCTMGSGDIRLFIPETGDKLNPGETVAYSIAVDDESFDLKGRTLANEEAGTTSIETSLAPADPLFAALQRADRFKIEIPGHEQIYPLTDADVAGLLRLCAKP